MSDISGERVFIPAGGHWIFRAANVVCESLYPPLSDLETFDKNPVTLDGIIYFRSNINPPN